MKSRTSSNVKNRLAKRVQGMSKDGDMRTGLNKEMRGNEYHFNDISKVDRVLHVDFFNEFKDDFDDEDLA